MSFVFITKYNYFLENEICLIKLNENNRSPYNVHLEIIKTAWEINFALSLV